ncbi:MULTISPECIES: cobalamin adenosyltransferase [Clostridium]|uniref:Cobalamin adenosyltransferase n=2 Tax=Clostridium TaxID=1485 RepID=A0A162JGC3_9CLOT|nr:MULTISPECIES: cobalamin adenosyltransferase [Clostridium]OAA94715.1 Cobalamin adenosyltransferase [Clostridium coskatii]OBR93379.1 cobalamin adenosyltransferase [Clostridium coskatii]RMD02090.1 cobalamin adenosyltransferase [Clostridium autoethanogenum]
MSVLTEYELRTSLRNKNISEYAIAKNVIVTPSARQYLNDKNIKLVIKEEDNEKKSALPNNVAPIDKTIKPVYVTLQGGYYEKKPEFMTQLYGNKLVYKDHPRIILRGELDNLESNILEAQVKAEKNKCSSLRKDLGEVLKFVRNILRAEVLEEKLGDLVLLGMNDSELREMSHHPKKYFNVDHFITQADMGEMVVMLNSLRSYSRKVEICAFKAFKNMEGVLTREDIVMYLNRLSSCFYIMMCKYKAGMYK